MKNKIKNKMKAHISIMMSDTFCVEDFNEENNSDVSLRRNPLPR